MKKRTKIVLSVLLLAAAILTIVLVTRPEETPGIHFYKEHSWPFREVFPENQAFIKDLYQEWSPQISEIWAAQDSRSRKCMRIILLSEMPLEPEDQFQILDEFFFHMNWLQDSDKIYPYYWEIYFAQDELIYSAYISRHGTSIDRTDENARFQPWEKIPDAENWLSLSAVKKMLEATSHPLYQSSKLPISEMVPDTADFVD